MQTSGAMRREIAKLYPRHCERSEAIHLSACRAMDCFAALAMTWKRRGVLDPPHARGMTAVGLTQVHHTGSAIEYFTWLSAKLDSIEAIPSSRVSLFFRNVS